MTAVNTGTGQHVILRTFKGPGGTVLQPGDVVDATGWRNRAKLEEQRYIRPQFADLSTVDERLAAVEGRLAAIGEDGDAPEGGSSQDRGDGPKTGTERARRGSKGSDVRRTGKE